MDDGLVFRDADPSEDDELARIMYNAFLPIWNHNWFQCLSSPLALIPATTSPPTPLQAARLAFYRSWFRLVRVHSGAVTLAYTPSTVHPAPSATNPPLFFTTSPSNDIAAVVLLLPPHARPSWADPLIAWRTGLLPALLGLGARGMYRVCVTFEGNVERMIAKGLQARNVAEGKQVNLLMCHGCVRNPEWTGEKPARRLLEWTIERWWEGEEGKGGRPTPVWLDTSVEEGVRAYEEIGFEVLGEMGVDTGCDVEGVRLRAEDTGEDREKARKRSRQWVMLKMPPGEGKGGVE
ncbi:MAG: hypothetical protein HETSPECPRED_003659 [Heterodermia speciosa]|uniref:Uncharacterized protein n=1 Tax=Heterodermia speciosa TaxID=116794 RepID=A0A8H3F6L0_9LECA|nr:MAG: hypothetical protein HETSPECPRED_003659 [Heterodermia speciosa]